MAKQPHIMLVCGHFIPALGYLEVHLAKAFAKLGNPTIVLTTDQVPGYVQSLVENGFKPGIEDHADGYQINRLSPHFSKGQMVKAKGMEAALADFRPDLVICIGVGKLFPAPIYKLLKTRFTTITLLGDNEDTHEKSLRKRLTNLLKIPVYKASIKRSAHLFSYTPTTAEIVKTMVPKTLHGQIDAKNHQISLGFDPQQFFFDEKARIEVRNKLGIGANEKVLITATRVTAFKQLEKVIACVNQLNQGTDKLHYVLVGFGEDEYATQLKQHIAQQSNAAYMHCFPFQDHAGLRSFYAAADFGLWTNAAISIFEALGTGLPLLLPQKTNVSHILEPGQNGLYYETHQLEAAVKQLWEQEKKQASDRLALAKLNARKFAYENLAKTLLEVSIT